MRTEAAAKGLAVEFDRTGRLIVRTSSEVAASIDKTTRSIERQTQALQKQRRLTSDGLEKNADGSARGTFGNTVPLDVASSIRDKRDRGELTADDLADARTAVQQAQRAQYWLNSMSPGAVSIEALNSTAALLRAATDALQKVQGMQPSQSKGSGSAASEGYSVTVNLNGSRTRIGTATRNDADALTGLLQQLEGSAGVAA